MDSLQILNLDDFRSRVDGDEELIGVLFQMFLDECPRVLGNIEAAVAAQDASALDAAAHELKGMCANIGANALREAAYQLERMGKEARLAETPQGYQALQQACETTQASVQAYLNG